MTPAQLKQALACSVKAARAAGSLMRRNLHLPKKVNLRSAHDIKLELDVRSQKLIERTLHAKFPSIAFLGEEGDTGDFGARLRWVVDPIDGTVNFSYGIPHACVSIALQRREPSGSKEFQTIVGVVYDPFSDELWTAIRGQPARLNGRIIHVSTRKALREAIISMGFGKSSGSLKHTLPYFGALVRKVRKVRLMGAAALGIVYVASGRFDAYIERGIRLWDIAAGGLILECAGGDFFHEPIPGRHAYRMLASNGHVRKKLEKLR